MLLQRGPAYRHGLRSFYAEPGADSELGYGALIGELHRWPKAALSDVGSEGEKPSGQSCK